MSKISAEALNKPVDLQIVRWEGGLRCAYLNNFRIAGGKPWGGGSAEKSWPVTLKDVIRAFPELQEALGLDYLGNPIKEPS